MTANSIEKIREKIRRKDREIVRLLNDRARLSVEVGRVKDREGLEIFDPAQEHRILEELAILNEGPLPDGSLHNIYREIFSSSRELQAPLTVACLGPEGTFAHLAVLNRFGRSTRVLLQGTVEGIFDAVEKGQSRLGVAPLENSAEGSVKRTLDRLISTPLSICGEIYVRVAHCLMSTRGDRRKIRRVYSHPQALAQCRGWLAANLPRAVPVETESTSAAVLRVLEDREGAAIGSRLAAETFGVDILEEGIEDNPSNTTRFIVLGAGGSKPTGRDKTSILFGTPHAPGALYEVLDPIAREGINLLRIESYPRRDRPWEYLFFVDFEGHFEDRTAKNCLAALRRKTAFLKVLGSYPRGDRKP